MTVTPVRGAPVVEFLRELAAQGIHFSLAGDGVRCRAPEGRVTPELRSEIASRKPEIVRFLRSSVDSPDAGLVLERAPDGNVPLSFAQQRLWFLHKLNPDGTAYNLAIQVPVPAEADDALIARSLTLLVRRHAILRTLFVDLDGIPSQRVTDWVPTLQILHASGETDEARNLDASRLAQAQADLPFALEALPPFRATIIRAGSASRLVLVLHHIVADGWSLGLLVRDLKAYYDAELHGHFAELPPLPWRYVDYAYSARAQFEDTDQERHADYWRAKVSRGLTLLDLPTDHPRPLALGSRGAVATFAFAPALSEKLRMLGRESGGTLFTTFVTLFKILLHRYSGQTDIVLGTPVANRTRTDLEAVVGLFVSTLLLRSDLSGDPTARALLNRIRLDTLEAREHADYPFEKIVELARPDRSLAHSPLFQASLVVQNSPGARTYDSLSGGAIFELTLYVWDGPGGLAGSFEYNRDLFEPET
ncbi:MAG TPA: condensation domain-containing protein, partial [Polyangiaceae bacterium]